MTTRPSKEEEVHKELKLPKCHKSPSPDNVFGEKSCWPIVEFAGSVPDNLAPAVFMDVGILLVRGLTVQNSGNIDPRGPGWFSL